jgi:type IV secretion system protein VirB9
MMVYDYVPGTLYQIYAAPERVTDIALQPGEELTATPATGDSVRWLLGETVSGQGATRQTHVLVKPLRPGLHNNIVLTTNRRVYHLECHSFVKTYMAAVAWRYPHDGLTPRARPTVTPRETASASVEAFDPATLHFAYTITSTDAPPWQPLRVFDTGHKTYIQFPPALAASEAPALFVRSTPGGALQLVNYRVQTTDQGTYYIIDRLFEQAELRVGAPKPTVVRLARQPS